MNRDNLTILWLTCGIVHLLCLHYLVGCSTADRADVLDVWPVAASNATAVVTTTTSTTTTTSPPSTPTTTQPDPVRPYVVKYGSRYMVVGRAGWRHDSVDCRVGRPGKETDVPGNAYHHHSRPVWHPSPQQCKGREVWAVFMRGTNRVWEGRVRP